jgi:argininosuccinate lyase
MMPQKKNPDVVELARGKTGRVYGSLLALLTVLKGLPLAYNKDLQEDKEGLFDTVKTLKQTLEIFVPLLASMQINKTVMYQAACKDYSNATQLANYLVKQRVPFRKAHEITGKIVLFFMENNLLLTQLPLEKFQIFHPSIQTDIYDYLILENVIETHHVIGGTAKNPVLLQFEQAENKLEKIELWLCSQYKLLDIDL